MLDLLLGWIGIAIYIASVFGAAAYRMRETHSKSASRSAPETLGA